ncbi:MAG: hypothetical protein ACKOJF_21585, partial [Planctomycetaceae bacterium]
PGGHASAPRLPPRGGAPAADAAAAFGAAGRGLSGEPNAWTRLPRATTGDDLVRIRRAGGSLRELL